MNAATTAVLLMSFVCLIAGCETQMAALSGRQAISPADFADESAAPNVSSSAAEAATFVDSDAERGPDVEVLAADHAAIDALASEPIEAVTPDVEPVAVVPAPTPPTSAGRAGAESPSASGSSGTLMPDRAGQRVVVDSLIGQVNGRPIFADEFLEPIEDQILAARAQLRPQDFITEMERIIADRLRIVLFNELVLAEAETMLTEEMRVGLRYWLKTEEEKRLAKSLGVRARAEEELAEEGMTLDEYLAIKEDEAKIGSLIQSKIRPRVIVTWRDMEREYERRFNEFNPKASITVSKIVLNRQREPELVEAVESGLATGKSFEEIGTTLARSSAYSDDTYQLGDDGLAGLPLNPKILDAIKDLKTGETSNPVEIEIPSSQPQGEPRTTVYWYHIKSIEQPEARTLYDPAVQRALYNELYRRRTNEEQDRYLQSLLGKGIYDDQEEMLLRLRLIALKRYGRPS